MRVSESDIVAVDFETTGTAGSYADEPWQIGMIHLGGGSVNPDYMLSRLLRVAPDRPFNPYAPGRHASLRLELAEASTLGELWPQIGPWLNGRVLAAHHAATERNVLEQAFPLHDFGPWIDTLRLARIAYPKASSHRLEDLLEILGLFEEVLAICPDLKPHDALFDAVACGVLLQHLLALPHWEGVTVEELVSARPGRP